MMVAMARREDEELLIGQRISRNLQALLRARKLRQSDLAEKSGLSTSNVSNLVNGRKNPSFLSVAKAAVALNVDPLELAGFKPLQVPEVLPDRPVTPEDFDELVQQVKKLTKTVREIEEARQGEPQSRTGRKRPA